MAVMGPAEKDNLWELRHPHPPVLSRYPHLHPSDPEANPDPYPTACCEIGEHLGGFFNKQLILCSGGSWCDGILGM